MKKGTEGTGKSVKEYLTAKEFCEKLNISRSTFNRMLTGSILT
jgi:hypothetical protein